MDGPFANYKIKMGPGLFVTEHCYVRDSKVPVIGRLQPTQLIAKKHQPTDSFRVRMSSFTITNSTSGTVYKSDEFLREFISLAKLLAKNARLEVPLGQDEDLSEAESKETQQQVRVFIPS